MSKQIIAYGALVERSTDGITYTKIPECKSIAVPAVSTEYLDATSFDSPDQFREYVKGLKDAGEFTVSAGYTANGYEQQIADQASDEPIYYRTTFRPAPGQASGDVFTFRAFPTPSVEGDDVGSLIGMTITLRTSGGLGWQKGAAA